MPLVELDEPSRHWSARAACAGLDTALWFPERMLDGDNHARAAKAICAGCPVVVECLEDALRRRDYRDGILGGASPRHRKALYLAWLERTHDYTQTCSSPACGWCPAVREHLGRLSGEVDAPLQLNGDGATHGRRSTYARGCRCGECAFAISATGVRFDYAGWDIPTWWGETFGANRSPDLIDVAKWYAAALMREGREAAA